jgi:hypothetical protein
MKTSRLFVIIAAICCLGYQNPLKAQTFEDITKNGQLLSNRLCHEGKHSYVCSVYKKDNKEYLLLYQDDGRPLLVIRREDDKVIWVAGAAA